VSFLNLIFVQKIHEPAQSVVELLFLTINLAMTPTRHTTKTNYVKTLCRSRYSHSVL